MSEEQMLTAYADTRPRQPVPKPYQYQVSGFKVAPEALVPLTVGGEPATTTPGLATVHDGRWRIPWSGDPRYLCLGNLNTDQVVSIQGCVLVDKEPPASVVVEVSVGGLGVTS